MILLKNDAPSASSGQACEPHVYWLARQFILDL
jgi:hypothetical protein